MQALVQAPLEQEPMLRTVRETVRGILQDPLKQNSLRRTVCCPFGLWFPADVGWQGAIVLRVAPSAAGTTYSQV